MATMKQFKASARSLEGFQIKTEMRNHELTIDQPEGQGGKNAGPSSLELLLASLSACVVTMGKIIAKQKRIQFRRMDVEVTGEINYDIAMGKTNEGFAGFQKINVDISIDSDQSLEDKRLFVEEIESRCPVTNTFKGASEVAVNVK